LVNEHLATYAAQMRHTRNILKEKLSALTPVTWLSGIFLLSILTLMIKFKKSHACLILCWYLCPKFQVVKILSSPSTGRFLLQQEQLVTQDQSDLVFSTRAGLIFMFKSGQFVFLLAARPRKSKFYALLI